MKKILLILSIFGMIGLVACADTAPYDLETENEIIVGLEAAYRPFNWMVTESSENTYPLNYDGNTYVAGYDVQIAKEIAKSLGKTLVIKAIDWDGLITALQVGEIDLIIAGMSPTEERKLQINFTNEYYRSEVVMVVKQDGSYVNATKLSDFDNANIVAQQGTLYDNLITDQMPNAHKNQALGTYTELSISVTAGVSDAFIAEYPVALSIVESNEELSIVRLTEGGFDMEIADIVVSIGARLIDNDLVNKVNEILANISNEQRNKWMLNAIELSK